MRRQVNMAVSPELYDELRRRANGGPVAACALALIKQALADGAPEPEPDGSDVAVLFRDLTKRQDETLLAIHELGEWLAMQAPRERNTARIREEARKRAEEKVRPARRQLWPRA
jgi:hypothetical protein